MKIMLAIDGSEHSNFAVDETADGFWPANSELKILTVVQHSDREIKEAARELVDQAISRVTHGKAKFASIKGEVLKGYPKKAVLTEAETWKPDLLMAGSRGLKGLTRVVLGSVSHALLLGSSCSVRIIRRHNKTAECEHAPRILLAVDQSAYSKHALEKIAQRPWPEGTSFLCVTAVPTLTQLMHDEQVCFSFENVKGEHGEKMVSAKRHLEKMIDMLKRTAPNVEVQSEVIDGDPRESLVEKADNWHADLIVMGCKGKNLMDRLVIGSVSEAVVTWASCSVEVVKK